MQLLLATRASVEWSQKQQTQFPTTDSYAQKTSPFILYVL